MMNPEVKALWVEALRSGTYTQTQGMLRRGEQVDGGAVPGFCCLGVLCDLHLKHVGTVDGVWLENDGDPKYREDTGQYCFAGNGLTLPPDVHKWSGLEDGRGDEVTIGEDTQRGLAAHNDSGRTFAQIADAIEAQL